MKKKVLAGIMMAVMVMASVMSVSAAGSRYEEAYPSDKNTAGYTTEAKADTFVDLVQEAQTAIKDMNADKIPESLVKDIPTIKETLNKKTLVTDVFDLEPFGDHPNCTKGHTVKLVVPALKNCKADSVVVLHYSEVDNKWEVVESSVDGTTITATFKTLSPVAIYAEVVTGGAAGTSPSTVGTSSTWMLWAAFAIVAVGAGVVASQKKNR